MPAAFVAGYWLAAWDINREIEKLGPEFSATAEATGAEIAAKFDDVIDDFESALNLNNAFLRGYRCLVDSVDNPDRWEEIRSALNRGSTHFQNIETDDPGDYRFVAEALNSELNSLSCARFDTEDVDAAPPPSRLITEETGE